MKASTSYQVLVVALVAIGFARPLHADDKADAQALHEQGLAHYETGTYDAAIEAYEAAYALFPAPGILFNLGQAFRLAGQCELAKRAYNDFLTEAPDSKQAPVALRHLDDLGPCPIVQEPATGPPPAMEPSPAAPSKRIDTSTPPPPIRRSRPPIAGETRVSDTGGQARFYGIVAGGLGSLLVAGGIAYGIDAAAKSKQIEDFINEGGQWNDALRATEAEGKRSEEIAIGATVLGVATLVGGGALYWFGSQDTEHARVSISSTGEDKLLVVSGAF